VDTSTAAINFIKFSVGFASSVDALDRGITRHTTTIA
jgi:hypothetical protein